MPKFIEELKSIIEIFDFDSLFEKQFQVKLFGLMSLSIILLK